MAWNSLPELLLPAAIPCASATKTRLLEAAIVPQTSIIRGKFERGRYSLPLSVALLSVRPESGRWLEPTQRGEETLGAVRPRVDYFRISSYLRWVPSLRV